MLVQGLLEGEISKVHINGWFTEEIAITRGVRQGDPLSSLLFALITQPLMEYLQFKLTIGELDGIRINDNLTICHRLFANDVRVFIPTKERNFTKLQEALNLYELASGAKLNLAKSVIIPLALPKIPQWLHNTSCSINKPREIHKYLGVPFGYQLKKIEMYNFCLDQISKRISGWAKKLLTFMGKVLIQHVLQSITTYHMMYNAASTSTLKQINRIFKDFLWRFDKVTSHRKTPLVAWHKLTQPIEHGGLGFIDCKAHSQALLSKQVSTALPDPTTEWVSLFLELFADFMWYQIKESYQQSSILSPRQIAIMLSLILQEHALHHRHMASMGSSLTTPTSHSDRQLDPSLLAR